MYQINSLIPPLNDILPFYDVDICRIMKKMKKFVIYYTGEIMKKWLIFIFILLIIIIIKLNQKKFYKNIELVKNPDDILTLVNKNNKLPAIYIPNILVEIPNSMSYNGKLVRFEVLKSFEKLWKIAKKNGYKITIVSAYRDYDYQAKLFENYVKEKGLKYALNCSAKAGHSEHQTGLAIDVMGSNGDYNLFEESTEFKWMKGHAHEYGFILRYPKGKEKITGFKYEPWHYRYVGIDIATYLYENNLTLEEYFRK